MIRLETPRRIHVVGVGGPGMSALARLLVGMGHRVSGSDLRDTSVLVALRAAGVAATVGHAASSVEGVDLVTYPTGLPETNIEIVAARAAGLPTVHRSEVLAAVTALAPTIGVAGTHGKTTTSSLLVHILVSNGLDPSWLIGADPKGDLAAAHWSSPQHALVVEADESDGTHARLALNRVVLTNVDKDHLDHFGSMDSLRDSFVRLLEDAEGEMIVAADDVETARVAALLSPRARARLVRFGTAEHADARISGAATTTTGMSFAVSFGGERAEVELPLLGMHNVLNFAAAATAAVGLGVPLERVAESARSFAGVERRLDHRGEIGGCPIYDDYAHVPAEIQATLRALRARHGDARLVAVFQPNRYHRIESMHGDYADSFADADVAVITDIYASGTRPIAGVTGRLVADAVRRSHPDAAVVWAPTRADVVREVLAVIGPDAICVGMGCGDIATLADDLAAATTSGPASQSRNDAPR